MVQPRGAKPHAIGPLRPGGTTARRSTQNEVLSMNIFSRITLVALTAAFVSSTALAGGVGGTGLGEIPMPKPKPIYIPIDIGGGSKPGNNGSDGGNSGNGTIYIPIDVSDPNDDPVIIPSDPIIPGGDGNSSGGGQPLTAQEIRSLEITCVVAGTPLDMPNDLWLSNPGKYALPAGLKIRFSVKATGQTGIFLLPEPIPAGGQLKIADILTATPAGAPCTVRTIA